MNSSTFKHSDVSSLPPPHLSKGLYNTLWPSDHGNTARQKYVINGGLPKNLDPNSIKLISNDALPYAQWMYTRDPDELYIYGAPYAKRARGYFAKVNSRTLEIIHQIELPQIAYIGGALIHANGDVYLVHGPRLYHFKGGDLTQRRDIPLPPSNGFFTQYNGMLVAEDGNLILKGWPLDYHDLPMIWKLFLLPIVPGFLVGLGLGILLLMMTQIGVWILPLLCLLGPLLFLWLAMKLSKTSLVAFFKANRRGHLLCINPETLEIISKTTPPERPAFGRMAMAPIETPEGAGEEQGEWLVIAADEHILRWTYHNGAFTHDPSWSERYRTWGDGSYPGTGPSIYGDATYYTDNTFPVHLKGGYHLYRKSLWDTSPQLTVDIATSAPGYMFFSTVIDPATNSVLLWDTQNSQVESRDLDDLSLNWETNIFNTDCIVVASDRGHVYATDHSEPLALMDMLRSAGRRPTFDHVSKDFLVLDATSGAELLRTSLGKASPVASMIVPGMNNDVFVALRDRLFRVCA